MLKRLDLRGRGPDFRDVLPRPNLVDEGPVAEVRAIVDDVRTRGDVALREYTARFDMVDLGEIRVPPSEIASSPGRLQPALLAALTEAAEAIESFHRHRPSDPGTFERNGISVELLELPVARAGVYVPGGLARYPSSVLMTAIPARVAGVEGIAVCVPPAPDGAIPVEVLAAANLAGVHEIYRVGGPQAIAAMAYGTETVARVDVIVGPGSRRVSLAKLEVRSAVGMPASFAGPSEVVVIADESVPVDYVAIDLVVQAEHGPDGLAWLITWSEPVLNAVTSSVASLVEQSPRRAEIEATLAGGGYAVLVDGPEAAMAVSNEIAPEHLELCCDDPRAMVPFVRNAGAVFLGPYTPASLGDYIAGPSHTLPTFRSARYASVLGVEDFLRRVHVISADRRALERAAPHVAAIARAEGLAAHASSVTLRCDDQHRQPA
ncbi:MAG: histidinol dehydrogenase [Acidimicrobiales bacterium]|jgi:histidinol dehydrogenase